MQGVPNSFPLPTSFNSFNLYANPKLDKIVFLAFHRSPVSLTPLFSQFHLELEMQLLNYCESSCSCSISTQAGSRK